MRRDECLATIVTTAAFVIGVVIAPVAAQQQQQPPKGQQPAVASGSKAATVDLDELESNPEKFLGKTVTVEGEVDTVLGPHLFTIDEKNWADPEREMPVFVAEPFAAMVRADAPVRVTGTVEKLPIARIDQEPGLLGAPKVKAEIEAKPVLVASEVTTIAPTVVSLRTRTDTPAGTSGSGAGAIMTDAGEIAGAKDKNLVGRRVDLSNAPVSGVTDDGFWIRLPSGERIFVVPPKKGAVREGQTAAVQGVVLELPEGLRVKLNAADEPIYIYADRVTPR